MEDKKYIAYVKKHHKKLMTKRSYQISFFIIICAVLFYFFLYRPPSNFPKGEIITIDSGQSLQNITDNLYNAHIIRSPFLFRSVAILLGGERRAIAGEYLLAKPQGPFVLAWRIVAGDFQIEFKRITVVEGQTNAQIADTLQKNLAGFSKTEFLTLAKDDAGTLFPDTYFIASSTSSQKIIDLIENNFTKKVLSIQNIYTSGHSLNEILTMASILQDEAPDTASRKVISGILWHRIAIGMPLQVDSPFLFIDGKNTFQLTVTDLKSKSLYNTYTHTGLPPGPIGNPGLDAILAALDPTPTNYLYYLSDNHGVMHYAVTYAEHEKNIRMYLR